MARQFTVEILYNHIGDISEKVAKRASEAVRKAASDIEAHAKMVVPVDTGTLKNSIQAQSTGELSAEVAPHTDYAVYVEYGTSRMRARPYMRPAAEKVRPGFITAMEKIVE